MIPTRRNSAEHAVWDKRDLLFLCTWGSGNQTTIGAAHFEDAEKSLPQIKMISCEPAVEDFTQINIFEQKMAKLRWPSEPTDTAAWREAWASAFTVRYRQVIQDSHTLTVCLAEEAKAIRDRILNTLKVETQNGYVHLLFEKFQNILIHDMTEQQFADMYAQTIVYGLFSARCMDKTQDDFSPEEAVACIPNTNPFLKSLMQECFSSDRTGSKLSFDELEIGNIVTLLQNTKTDAIITDFNRQTGGGREDPVIHFYEEFLTEYDKAQKVQRGVYYTPQPVVNFIVWAVDDILKSEFGVADGLASTDTKKIKVKRESYRKIQGFKRNIEVDEEVPAIQILDPATGTGTFLRQTILQIYQNFCDTRKGMPKEQIQSEWNDYVPKHLLPRLNGFELMMAPYAVAHMKLAMVLKDTGYDFHSGDRLQVYLTNSLEEPGMSENQMSLYYNDPLAMESVEANRAKKNVGINVVIGNPPYAGESSNKGSWIQKLMDDFKLEPGTTIKLKEANSKFINDDYIKFIRYAQYVLNSSTGVLCYINPHGYIDNPTFRGVRYKLLSTFDTIYILDLHGNSKKKEKSPNGTKDENVFDIQQGVCINLFIKKKETSKALAKVYHADLYGTRSEKYAFLNRCNFQRIEWREIPLVAPNYLFNYRENPVEAQYQSGFSVRELFVLGTLGVLSKRDSLVVAFSEDELVQKIERFADANTPIESICESFGIPIKDKDKWDALSAQKQLQGLSDYKDYVVQVHYRPFDIRSLFYFTDIIARPNMKVFQHIQNHDNKALVLCRQGGASNLDHWDCAFVVDSISDQNIYRRGGGTVLPLFLYDSNMGQTTKTANFDKGIIKKIENSLGMSLSDSQESGTFSPEDLLAYIYAILYSNKYREKYQEYLNKDFPVVPYPTRKEYFNRLVTLGNRLITLHTCFTTTSLCGTSIPAIHGEDTTISRPLLSNSKLFINKDTYLSPVSEESFEFTIGGNSPVQKWLKDRKGRHLSNDEILHLQKMISVIDETIGVIDDIDKIVQF